MEIKYKFSEIIEVSYHDKHTVLENIITKERSKITAMSLEVLNFIKAEFAGVSLLSLKFHFPSIDKIEMEEFFNFLIKKRIVIKTDEDAKILTVKPPYGIFGHHIESFHCVSNSIAFLGIPYGKGNMVDTGTRLYPDSIRFFTNKYGINQHIDKYSISTYDIGNIFFYENEHSFISYKKVEEIISALIYHDNLIFSLGGDHSITFPIIEGLTKKYNELRLIHFDAHNDHYRSKIQDLHQKSEFCSHHHGNFITKVMELDSVKEIYQYGLRDLKCQKTRPKGKLSPFRLDEEETFIASLQKLDEKVATYISFDIDIVDPINAPGTATPVINGISLNGIIEILKKIKLMKFKVVGVDFVEVNPSKDVGEITMQASVPLIQNLYNLFHANE